ncbi:helix-turn-helix transcriptional regulator [Photobacterium kishitanii]|uniref:helix-turn-helix transcriptional regulator n=1 Tax=Photobacterium kishitanii TaxID=318456 RepID=UPI000D177624|nr:helix-turn-helix transcriptional regulator [Photobacterium kishitanii]PSW62332.1 helix-turn-helix transcriptional regulator [Photobacterium kishitanii]
MEPIKAQMILDVFNQLPGWWGFKNTDSTYIYANAEFSKMMGLENRQDCIGRTDFDMPSPTNKCASTFREQDLQVMRTEKVMRTLDIHPYYDGSWRAHLCTKVAWRDQNNDIIGVIFSGIELKDTAILEAGHWLCRSTEIQPIKKTYFNLTPEDSDIYLNTRESEVLFLTLYGKKPQSIAKNLNISVKTVETYILKLREKFNANSKPELIDLALNLGFGSNIPKSMLKTQLSITLS